MDRLSTSSGEIASDTASTASPSSKPKFSVVNHPLTPPQSEWLKQQSRHVAEVSKQLFEAEKAD